MRRLLRANFARLLKNKLFWILTCAELFLGALFPILHYMDEYYGAAEPPVRCGESHLSGLTEPPHFIY